MPRDVSVLVQTTDPAQHRPRSSPARQAPAVAPLAPARP